MLVSDAKQFYKGTVQGSAGHRAMLAVPLGCHIVHLREYVCICPWMLEHRGHRRDRGPLN